MRQLLTLPWTRSSPSETASIQFKSIRPHSVNNNRHDTDFDGVSEDMINVSMDQKSRLPLDEQPEEAQDKQDTLDTTPSKSTTCSSTCTSPALSVTPIRPGETSFLAFHHQYTIVRHLGEGSYSTVKQVKHRTTGNLYACKIVEKRRLSDVDRAALAQEVHVLSTVQHVNIMRLYEVIQDEATCYLITEYAPGGDLFDRIVQHGKFPELEAQVVTAALVDALAYCHSHNILHRDVKPENVLLSATNDVKLGDFGFARQLDAPDHVATDSCGTPGYAAPEILDGQSYSFAVDVFALGVVTYILLCGYPPFPMKLAQLRTHRFHVRFPSKDWAAISPSVKTLLAAMLHVDPSVRPTMAVLRTHPWIQTGRHVLVQRREEDETRRQETATTRQQARMESVRTQLGHKGLPAVKFGRTGTCHRTRLWLSTDGNVLTWQPKLRFQSLTRFFRRDNERSPSSGTHLAHFESTSILTNAPFRLDSPPFRHWWRSFCRTKPRALDKNIVPTSSSPASRSTASATASPTASLDDKSMIRFNEIHTILCGYHVVPLSTQKNARHTVDPTCCVTICTPGRQFHLKLRTQSVRDGFVAFLEDKKNRLEVPKRDTLNRPETNQQDE